MSLQIQTLINQIYVIDTHTTTIINKEDAYKYLSNKNKRADKGFFEVNEHATSTLSYFAHKNTKIALDKRSKNKLMQALITLSNKYKKEIEE